VPDPANVIGVPAAGSGGRLEGDEMTRTRIRRTLATTALALVATAGLTGCGPVAERTADATTWAAADAAFGDATLEAELLGAREPADGDRDVDGKRAGKRAGLRADRALLRKHVLHGEVIVQGRDGQTRPVVLQRGTVTAVNGGTVSVRSVDGFTQAYTLNASTRVVVDRKKADPAAIKVGAEVGVAATRDGNTLAARLVVAR